MSLSDMIEIPNRLCKVPDRTPRTQQGSLLFMFAGCYESSRQGGPHYEYIGEAARVIAAYAPDRIIWGSNSSHNSAKTTADYPDDAALLDLAMSWLPDDEGRRKCLLDIPQDLFFR